MMRLWLSICDRGTYLEMICRKFPKDNIQPPLSYYLEIINKFGFKDIVIVTEKDLRNPCIKQLKELMPDLKIQTSNLLDDMSTIMSARNLIVGQSSFSLCLGLASDKIKRIFIPQFDITNWFFHSRGYIAPNIHRYFFDPRWCVVPADFPLILQEKTPFSSQSYTETILIHSDILGNNSRVLHCG